MRAAASRSLDLLAAGLLAAAAVGVSFAPAVGTPARTALGLPLVLVLPGYAFTAVAFARDERWSADRIAFVLGSSIALAILTGLVLNFTPWGLERKSWAVALGGITVAAAAVALVRRASVPEEREPVRAIRLSAPRLVLAGVAILLAAAAVGVARLGAVQAKQQTKFTQLWMLPAQGGSNGSVRLGIGNDEGETVTYRLEIRAGKRILASWSPIVVRSGKRWTRTFHLGSKVPTGTRVEADLYRARAPGTVYRHVAFTISPTSTRR